MDRQAKPCYAAEIAQLADASEAAFALLDEAEAVGDREGAALWSERAWRTQERLHEMILDAHFTGDDLVEPISGNRGDELPL